LINVLASTTVETSAASAALWSSETEEWGCRKSEHVKGRPHRGQEFLFSEGQVPSHELSDGGAVGGTDAGTS
jgi:hypothetical protein